MNHTLSRGKDGQIRFSAKGGGVRYVLGSAIMALLMLASVLRAPPVAAAPAIHQSYFEHCQYGITPAEVERQADELLARMTLGEKLKLLAGSPHGWSSRQIKRLGIPQVQMRDASCGMGDWGRSTAYPASVCLAATWDRKLAYKEGVALAHDALARGVNVVLGPGINVEREPQDGRNYEFLGEDPFLTSAIAVGWIRGLQSRGVAACAKHFAGYEDGYGFSMNSIMSRRTLEELYLPPFRAAVQQGHVWSVMAAYYRLNGIYCSSNALLLNDILRQRWGFKGVVMSDWGGNHTCAHSLNAGLDLEMPNADYYSSANIRKALANRKVSMSIVNTHVRRILRLIIAMGLLKHHHLPDTNIPLDDPASAAVALRVAAEGTVLLKNNLHILPLQRGRLKRIVVWGPMAGQPITSAGGSGYVHPVHGLVSMLDAITKAAGPGVKVQYVSTPSCLYTRTVASPLVKLWGRGKLWTRSGRRGMAVEYFNNDSLAGPAVARGIDPKINFNWKNNRPVPQATQSTFSARWLGEIKIAKTGEYRFVCGSDDGSRLFLNGRLVINNWQEHSITNKATIVKLRAGRTYRLRVEYFNRSGLAQMEFGYHRTVKSLFSATDNQRIARANVIIACVGFGPKYEGEGQDRGYHLWGIQDHIIRYLAKRNPHVIVVVNAAAGIAMSDWIHHVAGLIYAWYPGENGNTAVAKIIFGKLDPSGRLPDTFGRHWCDEPAYGTFPAVHDAMYFASGIYTGYRWYDKKHIKPLYPFGFGLSYTSFAFQNLRVTSTGSGKQRVFNVTAQITNTGTMVGAEVAQLYIHPQVDRANRCVQTLRGFARVSLQPGQSNTVNMKLDWRDFAYYDTAADGWKVPAGKYKIAVGSSSTDEPLHEIITW